MARQRRLAKPITVDIDGVQSQYDVVRILRMDFDLAQILDHQRMSVQWAIGTLVKENGIDVFVPCPYGFTGNKYYDALPPAYVFGAFLSKVLPLGIGAFMDQIFADLEADGAIKSGTQEDYGLTPGA